jgi:hypothetical protein
MTNIINAVDYGVRNGVDSTDAMQKAVDAAIAQQKPLYVPKGTYILDSAKTIRVRVPAGKSFTMYGVGDGTVFKRKDGSATKDGQNMFYVQSTTGDVSIVTFYGFKIDGNARHNPLPIGNTDAYLWQHSASIKFTGSKTARIKNVLIHDVSAFDPLADHIFFSGSANSYVEYGHIYNFNGYNRNRVRSDITVTGGMKSLLVEDSTTTRLESELNAPYDEGVFNFIVKNTIVTEKLDIGGKAMTTDGTITHNFEGDGITANDVGLWNTKGFLKNSTLNLANADYTRINHIRGFTFDNVDFNIKPVGGKISPLAFQPYADNNVTINNCRFNVDSPDASVPSGYAVWFKAFDKGSTNMNYKVVNTTFDKRLKTNINVDRCGTVILQDNTYSGSVYAIRVYSKQEKPVNLTITGGDKSAVTGQFLYVESKEGLKLIQN